MKESTLEITENRLVERFPMEIPITVSALKENRKEEVFESITKDICSGGAFIKATQPLDMDIEVKLDLILPLDQLKKIKSKKVRIRVSGQVVRLTEDGIGICFDENYEISPVAD